MASDGSVKVSSTPSNSYYHLKMQCLLNADPNFTIDTLIIQEDVKEKFLPVHKSLISLFFRANSTSYRNLSGRQKGFALSFVLQERFLATNRVVIQMWCMLLQ